MLHPEAPGLSDARLGVLMKGEVQAKRESTRAVSEQLHSSQWTEKYVLTIVAHACSMPAHLHFVAKERPTNGSP
jgi:hypothetical protein